MLRRGNGRRGTGLVGTMARTAVVAGTATAVAGSVANRQEARQQERNQSAAAQQAAFDSQRQLADMQAQMAAMQAQNIQAAIPPAPAGTGGDDLLAKIQQLAALKEAGALTDAEFTAAKAKLLGL
jgi:hypothetical protein